MLLRLKDKDIPTRKYLLVAGVYESESGPGQRGARHAARLEKEGFPLDGFSVEFTPCYDTRYDIRTKDDPVIREKVERLLRTHPKFGIEFEEWDGKEVTMESQRDEIESLKAKMAKYEKLRMEEKVAK